MTAPDDATLQRTRRFRHLRHEFKADLQGRTSDGKIARGADGKVAPLSRADRVLVDMAALLSLRAAHMRDLILAGGQVSDEDLVRSANAALRAMKALEERTDRDNRRDLAASTEDLMQAQEEGLAELHAKAKAEAQAKAQAEEGNDG
jgi:hypothetical protein